MNKYTTAPNTIYYEFFSYMTYDTNQCRVLGALADRLDRTTFRVNETPQGLGRGQGGGVVGGFIRRKKWRKRVEKMLQMQQTRSLG
jgi:hypothetical protein